MYKLPSCKLIRWFPPQPISFFPRVPFRNIKNLCGLSTLKSFPTPHMLFHIQCKWTSASTSLIKKKEKHNKSIFHQMNLTKASTPHIPNKKKTEIENSQSQMPRSAALTLTSTRTARTMGNIIRESISSTQSKTKS